MGAAAVARQALVDGICAFAGYGDLGAYWYREPKKENSTRELQI